MDLDQLGDDLPIILSDFYIFCSILDYIHPTRKTLHESSTKEYTHRIGDPRIRPTRSEPELCDLFFGEDISHFFTYLFHENVRNRIVSFFHQYSIFELYIFASFYYTFLIIITFI